MKLEVLGINPGSLEHYPILWEPEYRAGGVHADIPVSRGSVWMLPLRSQGCLTPWRDLGETCFSVTFGKINSCCKPSDVPCSAYHLLPSCFLLT